jgi:hypothetical protein
MTEQELVKHCLLAICQKNGFDGQSSMTQRDFELISREIEDRTGTLISVSTLKRLLKGEFGRMPQNATLNAISSYLGSKNWQEYKTSMQKVVEQPVIGKSMEEGSQSRTWKINWKWAGAAVVATGIIVFFSFANLHSKPYGLEKAQFGARKTTDASIPNTVVFSYNIDDVQADSFFIQQSWDRRRRVRIYKHSYTLTDIYYEPGYHTAKLIANDSVIKTIDVSIPTGGWFLFAKAMGGKSIPQYIKNDNAVKNGVLSLDRSDLENSQVTITEEKIFGYTLFPRQLTLSSDDFIFTARARMKEVRNNHCPFIMYEVFCQRNFLFFKSMPRGCAGETQAQFGEQFFSGQKNDLSSLCYDLSEWQDIAIEVKNKIVTVSIGHKEVYKTTYLHSSGLVTGLGFFSNGLCEVDAVEIKGPDGKVLYQNDFNK